MGFRVRCSVFRAMGFGVGVGLGFFFKRGWFWALLKLFKSLLWCWGFVNGCLVGFWC